MCVYFTSGYTACKQDRVLCNVNNAPLFNQQNGGPFSWVKKAAGKLRRGSYSRPAKKGEVDDLLNSEAFLKKKVQMLEKQIKATQDDIKGAEEEAQKVWDEWGPQVQKRIASRDEGLSLNESETKPGRI